MEFMSFKGCKCIQFMKEYWLSKTAPKYVQGSQNQCPIKVLLDCSITGLFLGVFNGHFNLKLSFYPT